ncbi:pre-mRNA cleavage factor Im 25 kDa subunit 1-like [Gossypium australe]|uniref:Pre-mRNA cleavage factor Im 25 kDa subunit 1-like n=1 Tax=Gossypium australe TaxID=47621 RepID=A0A5B6X9M5_9ROSI|nr:pre-mRNA cleavage factor Im 25 kDa subunit 1-like [Gossypium australe]
MGDLHMGVEAEAINDSSSDNHSKRVDIYPLSCYYFGSKEAIVFKDETLSDRINRMKSNYAAYGLRTSVEAVILTFESHFQTCSAWLTVSRLEAPPGSREHRYLGLRYDC